MANEIGLKGKPLAQSITNALADYPGQWRSLIDEWRGNTKEDAVWLMYSANYLLRTAGVRWALDPYYLPHRLGLQENHDLSADLSGLELVAFSHAHNDHLDLNLIRKLSSLPITVIVPEFMAEPVLDSAHWDIEKIILAQPGKLIRYKNLTITPFKGAHFRGDRGIEELGYLVEFNQKHWLFPGDIRNFDSSLFPDFGDLDGIFAHLWLGKGCALDPKPPLLNDFITFFAHQKTRQLVVTHMNEIGRSSEELWDLRHYQLVLEQIYQANPAIRMIPALTGQKVNL